MNRREFLTEAAAASAAAYTSRIGMAVEMSTAVARLYAGVLASSLLPVRMGALQDVARNRSSHQSAAADDDHCAHLATDGSPDTYWQAPPEGEQWIVVDLGREYALGEITVAWGATAAQQYVVDASSDAHAPMHWIRLCTISSPGDRRHVLPVHGARARYLRLTGTSAQPGRGMQLVEFGAWTEVAVHAASAPLQQFNLSGGELQTGWLIQAVPFTKADAHAISSPQQRATDWLPAVVPGTVLTSYVAAGAVPEPFYANQQTEVSEAFFTRNDFWYRHTFIIDPTCHGRRVWLIFEGINWKADVRFNGVNLGRIEGAFRRSRFDISSHARVGEENCVAVLIHQVAHPGVVMHKELGKTYSNGGVLGLDSPTFLASIGWNWLPTIPGRNTGIWNHVRFETTGDILIEDPWVEAKVAPDRSYADLCVHVELRNGSSRRKNCRLEIALGDITMRSQHMVAAKETKSVRFAVEEFEQLRIRNPRLWWPSGYGEPALHTVVISVRCDGAVSDTRTVTFGIRSLKYTTDDGVLRIHVNGEPIQVRGGNWGMEEGMLRCDAAGYDLRVRLHRAAGLNMIRNWVGMVGREEFYDACDRHGILVWDDFWLANPSDGPDPQDHAMFLANAQDKVLHVRKHACVALYCGRNEGDPPQDLDEGMRALTQSLDGTRLYVSNSAAGAVTGHGPYENMDPAWYFEHRGSTFHTEQGIVCVPSATSMRAMLPESALWPINDLWAVHDYQKPRSEQNTERIARLYGAPTGIDDYCRKAQMVNFETAKAIFECLRSNGGGGQMLWMSQAAWPALICQIYDYYFEQTAAFFGTRSACEPIHILWDQHRNEVRVANNTLEDATSVRAEAAVYDLHGNEIWRDAAMVSVPHAAVHTCFPLAFPATKNGVFFVKLWLRSGKRTVSDNFYWSSTGTSFRGLASMPVQKLHVSASRQQTGMEEAVALVLHNPNRGIALAAHVTLLQADTLARVLPALFSDNYVSLLPGETRTMHVTLPGFHDGRLRAVVDGWNVARDEIGIE